MSLCPTPGAAMVLLASGIVDEAPVIGCWTFSVLSPPACPVGAWNLEAPVRDGGSDTLLSFEGSGSREAVDLRVSFTTVAPCGWRVGVGGHDLCELDSGREHLAVALIAPP